MFFSELSAPLSGCRKVLGATAVESLLMRVMRLSIIEKVDRRRPVAWWA